MKANSKDFKDWTQGKNVFQRASFMLAIFCLTCHAALGAESPIETPTEAKETSEAIKPSIQPDAEILKQQAIQAAIKVADTYADSPMSHVLLGSAYYNIGQSDEATRHLNQSLKMQPDLMEPRIMLAKIAYEKGDPEESVRICEEAMKHGKPHPEIMNRLGQAQMDMGRTEEAIAALKNAVVLAYVSPESWYLLGQAHMQARQFDLAKTAFLNTVRINPKHTQAYFGLFTSCQRLGETEEAANYRDLFVQNEAEDRKALSERSADKENLSGMEMLKDVSARTFFGAGQMHLANGNTEEAAKLFYQSAELDQENQNYRLAIETLYVSTQQLEKGMKVFDRMSKAHPTNPLNHYFLGRLATRSKQLEEAETHYKRARYLWPDWAAAYHALAELYMIGNRNFEDAVQMAAKAVMLEPNAARYYLLSAACIKTRNLEGALNAIRRAVELDPEDQRYQGLLKQLEKAAANTKKP
jgi:tetratricopeptide (TPR) repeat protein